MQLQLRERGPSVGIGQRGNRSDGPVPAAVRPGLAMFGMGIFLLPGRSGAGIRIMLVVTIVRLRLCLPMPGMGVGPWLTVARVGIRLKLGMAGMRVGTGLPVDRVPVARAGWAGRVVLGRPLIVRMRRRGLLGVGVGRGGQDEGDGEGEGASVHSSTLTSRIIPASM
ncbi:hypothetical protein QFW77_09065 [Luteimonas sp. RD2P54]|uniref:Uncharacterized protein n=1 Tax=Luteimonas endophytica TaxID=3042023 RepID=A0ABT6J8I1_9GAMM|nr:hypothetical protein [Luteimonas endophytica]MDH5823137.1 hypothetical protein [Luteimonas endophytica]